MPVSARFLSVFTASSLLVAATHAPFAQAQTKPRVQVPATSRTQAQSLVQQLLREGKIMRPRDAKRGMKGYALSVFQGTTLEKFPVEIIGILESVNGGGDFVMFRVTGGTVVKRNSGIVEGMSGSPVYINGKLLGAIAIGFGFPKEPIGGITPITDMIATTLPDPTHARVAPAAKPNPSAKPDAASTPSAKPKATSSTRSATDRSATQTSFNNEIELRPREALNVAGRRVARVVVSRNPLRSAFSGANQSSTMTMRPASLRLQMSGFSADGAARMNTLLSPYGMTTSQIAPSRGVFGVGSSGGFNAQVFGPSSKKSGVNPPFIAGGAIGAQMVSGDMDMTGVGTITYRIGNRVLAFGHPMLGIGSISLPMTSVYVHDIFPSYEASFKLASPVRTVGTVQQDTNYAIGGTIGVKADTVPMTVFIRNNARQIAKTYRVQIMKDPVLTPNLVMSVAAEMLDATLGKDSDKMVRVALTMNLRGQKPVVRRNYIYGSSAPIGAFNPAAGQVGAALQDLYQAVAFTQTSDFGRAAIQSLQMTVDVLPTRKTAIIKNMFADRNKIKAGETIKLSVEIEPSETPGKTITKTFSFKVPLDAPAGTMRFGAASSSDYWALATRVGEAPPTLQNLSQLLAAYGKIGATDELVVQASTPRTYLVVDNKRLPSPPASFSRLLRSGGSGNIGAFNETQTQRERSEYALEGLQLLAIPVESARHSDTTAPDSTNASGDSGASTSAVVTPATSTIGEPASGEPAGSNGDLGDEAAAPFASVPQSMSAHLFKTPFLPMKTAPSTTKKSSASPFQLNDFEYSKSRRGGFLLASMDSGFNAAASPTPQNPIAPSAAELVRPTPMATPIGVVAPSPSASPTPIGSATPIGSVTPTPTPVDNGVNLSRPSSRWIQNSPLDFLRGEFVGTQVTSEGTIALSPRTRRILTTPDPFAWSIAGDSLGNTYIGTGNDARLYKVSPDGKSRVIYDGDEIAVTALAVDKANNVYAGVSPGGRVLRFSPDGKSTLIFSSSNPYIWALKFDDQGRLLIATGGDKGQLYRLASPAELDALPPTINGRMAFLGNLPKIGQLFRSPLATVKSRHIRSIATRGDEIFIGTSDDGVLYRVDGTSGKTTALYEAVAPGSGTTSTGVDIGAALAALTGNSSAPAPASGEILAITTTPDAVYFGTSNSGTIFRWDENKGVTPIYPSPQSSIYAMTTAPDGSLYVATGEKGVVYNVRPTTSPTDVVSARVLEPTQTQSLALNLAPNGDLLVGTGNNAAAYRADLKNLNGGSFTSNIFDAKNIVKWGAIRANARGARWETRSGNTLEPDATWSAWQQTTQNDLGEMRVVSPPARYLQYRVLLDASPTATDKAPQVSRIEVIYRTQNSAPQIAWTSPAGGEWLRATPKISWQAQDADSDKLRYTLSISSDDGANWQAVTLKDATTPSFDLDTTKFKDGVYFLKVAASDANSNPDDPQSAAKISSPFTIDNTAPTLNASLGMRFSASVVISSQQTFPDGYKPDPSTEPQKISSIDAMATDATSPISGAEWRFVKATPIPTPTPSAMPSSPQSATKTIPPAVTKAKPATSSTRKATTTTTTTVVPPTSGKNASEASITIINTVSLAPEAATPPVADEWNAMAALDGIFDSRREQMIARPTDEEMANARKAKITQIEVRARDAAGNSATFKVDLPK